MSPLLGIALTAAGLLLAAAIGYGLVMAWRRAVRDDGPLPLFSMIKRYGLSQEEPEAGASAEFLALAVRRCALCGAKEQCRAWLAADADAAPFAYCPNARFFDQFGLRVQAGEITNARHSQKPKPALSL